MSKDFSPTSNYARNTSHLTEFYPYLNGSLQTATPTPPVVSRRDSFSTANSTYTSFAPSLLSYTNLISKTEIEETISCFNELLISSDEYRSALNTLVQASNKFAGSLENVAKLKGLDNSDGFLSASGLFYLIGNHQQIISENLKNSFECPLQREIEELNLKLEQNDQTFKENYKSLLKILKTQELENIKISKLKKRNLLNYKHNLLQLTSNLDEIDKLKHEYYTDSQSLVNQSSNKVLSRLSSSIRAQVEIYEGIARKGWSGNGLDDLIAQGLDPFLFDEEEEEEEQHLETQAEEGEDDHHTLTRMTQHQGAQDSYEEEDTIDTDDAYHQHDSPLQSHVNNKNGLRFGGGSTSNNTLPVLTTSSINADNAHIETSLGETSAHIDNLGILSSTPQQREQKFDTINSKESEDYYRNDTIINSNLDDVHVKDYHSDMLENKWRDKSLDMGKSSRCHGEVNGNICESHEGDSESHDNVSDEIDEIDDDDDDNSFSLPVLGSKDR
ncbi:hypothetical protein WICPIJ_003871 [Wickerhamomyces pijperi]|uniref:Protein IVY1 n=1 Tax=Wickerhamomyces pijperi TaxID=599730 RepID=A0A9P8Q952_WICPI|nr:hypothetical protein WICPIJ_003871 [Wickerhamomyces pijperi]